MDNYFINENTLVILPYGQNNTKVIENYISYIINKSVQDLINENCKYYNSSYLGRCEATEYLIGVKYKCPIIISENKEIIMFPTMSFKKVNCIWINAHAIIKYYKNNETVTIILRNNQKIDLNISERIITNQLFKSSRLESVLKSKKS